MPVTITGERLDQYIENLEARLNSPDLISLLAGDLSQKLQDGYHASGLNVRSGAALRALSYVAEPERTSNGWSMGVGDRDALGEESQSAPQGTLRQFFDDNPEIRPSKWAQIPPSYKDKLEQMRRSGMYGGRGPDYANYLWVQENGNGAANISPHPFIEASVEMWKANAPEMIDEWWSSLGVFGKVKRYIAGVFGR